ncbi:hypothetical protein Tco_0777289 [Tanacetum coccineum]
MLNHANNSFYNDERIVWVNIEGLPIHTLTRNKFVKVATKWGELVEMEDHEDKSLSCKRLCIKTKVDEIICEKFKVIVKGSVFWVRAKEMDTWALVFHEDKYVSYSSDEEDNDYGFDGMNGDKKKSNANEEENKVEKVSESSFVHENSFIHEKENNNNMTVEEEDKHSDDPFNLYNILNGKKNYLAKSGDEELKYPPGFTPEEVGDTRVQSPSHKENETGSTEDISTQSNGGSRI